jgi:hypothetical protein
MTASPRSAEPGATAGRGVVSVEFVMTSTISCRADDG